MLAIVGLLASAAPDSYMLLYMQAVAYHDLDRTSEAIAAARASVGARPNSPASGIIRDLGAQPSIY